MISKKVVVLREIPAVAIELLAKKYQVDVNQSGRVLTREQLYHRVKGASAIISLLTDRIDGAVVKAAGPHLAIVANYAVGFDNVELKALREKNIVVTNTPGGVTEAVAEHTLALTLAVARRVVEADKYVRSGRYKQWEPLLFLGQSLVGKTVGIIGAGRIGSAFGRMMHRALKAKLLYFDTQRNAELERSIGATKVSLNAIMERSDIISIHVCLTPQTKHLIGRAQLAAMKPTAILVNTARGPVIDESCLIDCLKNKSIFGTALDVYENEPHLIPGTRALNNIVLTPHIGSATDDARIEMAVTAARNVIAVLSGHVPLNPV
ncbi:MAG: D-glycerate dehydrogenase [bacterium]|nr:D-glycerate dehydrogenase [bacterium]